VIDLHCHVLPGIDDGPATIADSIALARAAAADGTRTIVATPHVSWDYPATTAAVIADGVTAVNGALRDAGVPVTVVPGAEVALTRAADLTDDELIALRLGGGPWLLVEPPFSPGAAGLDLALHALAARGHRIVLAHPERCPGFLRDRELLARMVRDGMLCSVTAGSLTGRFGRTVQRFAHTILREGLVHDIASDAHDSGVRRPPLLAGEVRAAGFGDQADWLCRDVPEAILAGRRLPPAPPPPRPRGVLQRLLRRA
jgi:protein-tyrosine phosphatase